MSRAADLRTIAASSLVTLAVATAAQVTRSQIRALRKSCTLDDLDFPRETIHLEQVDGSHTGPATATLREHFLSENGSAKPVTDHFAYEEILRSISETTYSLAASLAVAEINAMHQCEDPECGPGTTEIESAAARVLVEVARNFEEQHEDHLPGCRTCGYAGLDAPGLLRARYARDVADDLLLNPSGTCLFVHGVPLQAAFEVLCSLVDIGEEMWGNSPQDQIDRMSEGLATVIGIHERRNAA